MNTQRDVRSKEVATVAYKSAFQGKNDFRRVLRRTAEDEDGDAAPLGSDRSSATQQKKVYREDEIDLTPVSRSVR